jgi:hypothetical protein
LLLEYADIYSKLEHLLQTRVYTPSESKSDLPQTGVATPDRSSSETASTTPSTQPNTVQNKTVVKCFPKAKMKYSLESYVMLFKSRGILIDWWEEDEDKVCFELKEKE